MFESTPILGTPIYHKNDDDTQEDRIYTLNHIAGGQYPDYYATNVIETVRSRFRISNSESGDVIFANNGIQQSCTTSGCTPITDITTFNVENKYRGDDDNHSSDNNHVLIL